MVVRSSGSSEGNKLISFDIIASTIDDKVVSPSEKSGVPSDALVRDKFLPRHPESVSQLED